MDNGKNLLVRRDDMGNPLAPAGDMNGVNACTACGRTFPSWSDGFRLHVCGGSLNERLLRVLGAWPNGYAGAVEEALPEVVDIIRREALEEAAKVCEALDDNANTMRLRVLPNAEECAAAIRALIKQE